MTVSELMNYIGAENLTQEADLNRLIECGYCCDLLSWVLAHGKQGMAWCTVQTHMNVVAVAVLMEMACIILAENVRPDESSLLKAKEEGIAILSTAKTAYEVAAMMGQAGIPAPDDRNEDLL